MEYILSFALLVLNLIDYERDLGHAVFAAASVVLFAALFYFVIRKTHNFLASCLIMMCHTWQISWINIFGDPTSKLQLPWFYIIGLFIIGYAIINVSKCRGKSYSVFMMVMFIAFLILSIYPLVIANSLSDGLKDYVRIAFYMVVLFAAYMFKDSISNECYDSIKSAFIWASVTTSVLLVFQYVAYTYFGRAFFKVRTSQYFSNTQISFYLLMEDHSCSTIMLGCSAFYIAERITRKKWMIYVPSLIVVFASMALTSRRTSTFTLAIVMVAYLMIHYKGLGKKMLFLIIFGIGITVMIYYVLVVRPVENVSQIMYDNGRIENYTSALNIIKNNPTGVGYGDVYIQSIMSDRYIPHNTLLHWMCMGGVVFPIPLVGAIFYVVMTAYKKKMSCEFWAIVYSIVASNFIPDILNARYLIIPCAAVFLIRTANNAAKDKPDAPPQAATEGVGITK